MRTISRPVCWAIGHRWFPTVIVRRTVHKYNPVAGELWVPTRAEEPDGTNDVWRIEEYEKACLRCGQLDRLYVGAVRAMQLTPSILALQSCFPGLAPRWAGWTSAPPSYHGYPGDWIS